MKKHINDMLYKLRSWQHSVSTKTSTIYSAQSDNRLMWYETCGYTIVEVMIVLAITGVLFASAVLFVSGRQQKTEFIQAINDVESQIQDLANDVSTGFYPSNNNFNCTATISSGPIISTGSAEQGTNEGCVFLGRVIQFSLGSDSFNVFTVTGRRQTSSSGSVKEVQTFAEANPLALGSTSTITMPSGIGPEVHPLLYGLRVVNMQYVDSNNPLSDSCSSSANCIGSVGFFSSFASYSGSLLSSGTQHVNSIVIPGSKLSNSALEAAEKINAISDSAPKNPNGGILICFKSGGTDQYGVIKLAGDGRSLSTERTIYDTKPSSGECTYED